MEGNLDTWTLGHLEVLQKSQVASSAASGHFHPDGNIAKLLTSCAIYLFDMKGLTLTCRGKPARWEIFLLNAWVHQVRLSPCKSLRPVPYFQLPDFVFPSWPALPVSHCTRTTNDKGYKCWCLRLALSTSYLIQFLKFIRWMLLSPYNRWRPWSSEKVKKKNTCLGSHSCERVVSLTGVRL